MTFSSWIKDEVTVVENWFTDEEAGVVKFFGPLVQQIIAAGAALGKATVADGVKVILDGAMSAATSAATATGDKVATAEAAFVSTVSTEGLTVVHNAEAGAIKAAVAIIQSAVGTLSTAPTATAAVLPPPAT